jgi:hypothetical protein
MSTAPTPKVPPLPDFLRSQEPVTLISIRKFRTTTMRGKDREPIQIAPLAAELEVYLNQTVFDLSMRIDEIERYFENEARVEKAPPEIASQLAEMLRELKFCSDIGNFAISQLAQRN